MPGSSRRRSPARRSRRRPVWAGRTGRARRPVHRRSRTRPGSPPDAAIGGTRSARSRAPGGARGCRWRSRTRTGPRRGSRPTRPGTRSASPTSPRRGVRSRTRSRAGCRRRSWHRGRSRASATRRAAVGGVALPRVDDAASTCRCRRSSRAIGRRSSAPRSPVRGRPVPPQAHQRRDDTSVVEPPAGGRLVRCDASTHRSKFAR